MRYIACFLALAVASTVIGCGVAQHDFDGALGYQALKYQMKHGRK